MLLEWVYLLLLCGKTKKGVKKTIIQFNKEIKKTNPYTLSTKEEKEFFTTTNFSLLKKLAMNIIAQNLTKKE